MSADELHSIMTLLNANYRGQVKDAPGMYALWVAAFGGMEANALRGAVLEYMGGNDYLPKISDIVKLLPQKAAPMLEAGDGDSRPGKDAATRNALSRMARYVLDNPDANDAPDLPEFCGRYLA